MTHNNLPEQIKKYINGRHTEQITEGMSGDIVLKLHHAHQPAYYLKMTKRRQLQPEHDHLRWMHGKLPVPEVIYFHQDETGEYLLITEVPGLMAHDEQLRHNIPELVRSMAYGLKQIHSVPISNCPFDRTLDIAIEAARQRIVSGAVDIDNLEPEYQGRTAGSLFEELLAARPVHEDLVWTHGDACLPNILIDPDTFAVNGFIDLGFAGIADRHQDLALTARSLGWNIGKEWVDLLFETYGRQHIDAHKLRFYTLLDEFF